MVSGRLSPPYTVSAPLVIMTSWVGTTGTKASAISRISNSAYAHMGDATSEMSSATTATSPEFSVRPDRA
ncbi:hypothetical protein V2I01_19130 [Micromonospora sp. BRA006-A]|nr:hypothetical protein [Micromonospora sp. BRA006-A]